MLVACIVCVSRSFSVRYWLPFVSARSLQRKCNSHFSDPAFSVPHSPPPFLHCPSLPQPLQRTLMLAHPTFRVSLVRACARLERRAIKKNTNNNQPAGAKGMSPFCFFCSCAFWSSQLLLFLFSFSSIRTMAPRRRGGGRPARGGGRPAVDDDARGRRWAWGGLRGPRGVKWMTSGGKQRGEG